MDQLDFQYEILRIRREHIKTGKLLEYINITYSDKLEWSLRTFLHWLKSENTPFFCEQEASKSI